MYKFSVQVAMTTDVCSKCGVMFALPCDLLEQRKQDGLPVFCVNGHSWSYRAPEDDPIEIEKRRATMLEIHRDDQHKAAMAALGRKGRNVDVKS